MNSNKIKPPQARVSDVLYMDKDYLRSVVQLIRNAMPLLKWDVSSDFNKYWRWAVQLGLIAPDAPKQPKLHMFGSYTFGNAKLRSDMDFGFAFPEWNTQVAASQLFYMPAFRSDFSKVVDRFSLDTGMILNFGCVDAQPERYNIHLDCDTWLLHFRYEPDLNFYEVAKVPEFTERFESVPPVNVMDFNQEKDIPPPVHNIHLTFDRYAHHWLPMKQAMMPLKHQPSQWNGDEYQDQQEPWKSRYGKRYNDYRVVDDKLIETIPQWQP